jgi:hypothetical protein
MPTICLFPGCKSWSIDNGLCTSHGKYYKPEDFKNLSKASFDKGILIGKVEKKVRKPIKKRSKKMTDVMKEVKKLYTIFLKSKPKCEVKSPQCTIVSTDVHHKAGRGKNQIADKKTWMAVCRSCHNLIENNDKWARDNGFKISQHTVK